MKVLRWNPGNVRQPEQHPYIPFWLLCFWYLVTISAYIPKFTFFFVCICVSLHNQSCTIKSSHVTNLHMSLGSSLSNWSQSINWNMHDHYIKTTPHIVCNIFFDDYPVSIMLCLKSTSLIVTYTNESCHSAKVKNKTSVIIVGSCNMWFLNGSLYIFLPQYFLGLYILFVMFII